MMGDMYFHQERYQEAGEFFARVLEYSIQVFGESADETSMARKEIMTYGVLAL